MEKKENIQFRILYFVGIFLIVASHCKGGSISLFYEWFPITSFVLPLFAFCSGYFFIKSKDEKLIVFIKKKAKKFLIPFFVWNFIYGIVVTILHCFGIKIGHSISFNTLFLMPIYDGHQFTFNLASWFIIPLFFIEIINIFIIKLANKKNIILYMWIVISLILGFFGVNLAINGYNTGMYLFLVRLLFLLPFFTLGILYRTKLESKDTINNIVYFAILFGITLLLIYIFNGVKGYTVSLGKEFDNCYRPFISGILGIAFWLRVSRILAPAFEKSKVLLKISRNTFSIMMHHLMGFFVLNSIIYGLSKIFTFIEGFDFAKYSTDIWYVYAPKNIFHFTLIYVVFGIVFSLFIAYIEEKIKKRLFRFTKKR